jgi:hypothetical protein
MSRRSLWRRCYLSWLVAGCGVLCAGPSPADERHRTPAEIELRRTEIAARLAVLADEEAVLTAPCCSSSSPR